jgi:hypothetical protein
LNDLRLCRWNLEWLDVFVDADDEPGGALEPWWQRKRDLEDPRGAR